MFYYYTHSWSYIGLSQFSLFNVRMYKITLSLYISDYWIISLHVWLRYWTHDYLIHHVSLCRVGLMVYQWCRIFMLHNRAHVMEHVHETSVSPQVFVFALCPQKWMRVHNLHFGLIISTGFLPNNLHHVHRHLVPLRTFARTSRGDVSQTVVVTDDTCSHVHVQ